MKVAITGKGGVGKTTLSSTLARLYADEGRTVLAADVDPDANLGLALGLTQEEVDAIVPISQLPVVGCAPEWMSEKAVSIGNYVVATGIETFLGVDPYVKGSSEICELLTGEHGVKDWVEANYTVELDIDKLGDMMIERIEQKRAALGI